MSLRHKRTAMPAVEQPEQAQRACVQARFYQRGQDAWEHYRRTGMSLSAGDVLAKVQAKLHAKRPQLQRPDVL